MISLEFEQLFWLVPAFVVQLLEHVDLRLSTDMPAMEPASLKQSEIVLSQPSLHKATGSSLLLPPPPQPPIDAAEDNAQTTDRTSFMRSELMHFSLWTGLRPAPP
jgi:hypothetical protein